MKSEPVSKDKTIGVYEPQTPSDCQPDSFTGSDDARRLVNNGEATRINRGKSIRLKIASAYKPLDRSEVSRYISSPGGARGLTAHPSAALILRHALAVNSGQDGAAIVAVQAWIGEVKLKPTTPGKAADEYHRSHWPF